MMMTDLTLVQPLPYCMLSTAPTPPISTTVLPSHLRDALRAKVVARFVQQQEDVTGWEGHFEEVLDSSEAAGQVLLATSDVGTGQVSTVTPFLYDWFGPGIVD